MNLFNRVVLVLQAAALIVGGLFVMGVAWGLTTPDTLRQSPDLTRLASGILAQPAPALLRSGLGGLAAVVAGVTLLALELWPRRRVRELVLRSGRDGSVAISLAGLKRLTEHVVLQVPGVEDVVAQAHPSRDGVAVRCRVSVKVEASSHQLADELRQRIDEAVQQHVGRPACPIHIHTRVGRPATSKRRVL